MSCRNARFRSPRNPGGDNHELPLVRPGRIHRRSVDHSCVSALATGETSKLVTEVFTAERSRSIADNGIADLRLQFVSIYRGGVLVFDKLGRAMESTQFQKTIETWLNKPRGDVRVVAGLMCDRPDRIPEDAMDRRRPCRSRALARLL